jgi:GNAT superfamily N-acetyltransferase
MIHSLIHVVDARVRGTFPAVHHALGCARYGVPMGGVIVRDRSADDLVGCVKALRAVHSVDRYPIRWPADPIAWLDPADTAGAWVAVEASRIVGHVAVRTPEKMDARVADEMNLAPQRSAMVSRLFTVPAARGRGEARRLLDRVHTWAATQGKELYLDVADNAPGARLFYERLGWRYVTSVHADWLGEDGRPALVHYYCSPGAG